MVKTQTSRQRSSTAGISVLVGASTCQQTGAAVGASLFPVLGPVGVVAFRQLVMAAVHVPISRPSPRKLSRSQLLWGIGLGVVMGLMNITLYLAVERIGLGLAVTMEFLGPLALALASSRRLLNAGSALLAAGGVLILAGPQTSNDGLGIALGLTAAVCWASYILVARSAGARIPGLQASALAAATSALIFVPIAAFTVDFTAITLSVIALGVLAGFMSSAVPYAADIFVLRRIPAGLYGLLMSINPVVAALAGFLLLSEDLGPVEITAIAMITAANAAAVTLNARGTAPLLRRKRP